MAKKVRVFRTREVADGHVTAVDMEPPREGLTLVNVQIEHKVNRNGKYTLVTAHWRN